MASRNPGAKVRCWAQPAAPSCGECLAGAAGRRAQTFLLLGYGQVDPIDVLFLAQGGGWLELRPDTGFGAWLRVGTAALALGEALSWAFCAKLCAATLQQPPGLSRSLAPLVFWVSRILNLWAVPIRLLLFQSISYSVFHPIHLRVFSSERGY